MSVDKSAAKFGHAMGCLLEQFEHTTKVLDQIIQAGVPASMIDDVPEYSPLVTVLEPMRLRLEADALLRQIKDIEIISYINTHDPKRVRVSHETGENWYATCQGKLTVNAIKSIRDCFWITNQQTGKKLTTYFDLRDARRVVELVKLGLL